MPRAFLAFNLLVIILPSTLYAEIDFEHIRILNESNKNLHGTGFSNVKMFEIKFVNPPISTKNAPDSFIIYGIDNGTQNAYLDLWSIDDSQEPTLQWAIQNFNKQLFANDESLIVTLTVPSGSSSGESGPAQDYRLTFASKDDYDSFLNTLLPHD